ncbi:hypothetical protein JX265_004499 [Neoarthrinium moseri]|uniref:Uncharacterized protein n=1 Tax=Neoarthrinium moseri TaxID=1658444 RepID=A0A9P9WRA5_9PEZI|nr:hypothetical protein JX265_004499 [Neoarthrinium moseri]
MDTPKIPPPRDEGEKQVLKELELILSELQILRADRANYVRSQDVMVLHDRTIEQVRRLNEIRQGKKTEENRVDRVVDSCFQLLSLFFMTIGRNKEAPAAYALTSTIKRLLDHLTEADLFSEKDLASMSHTLKRLSGILEKAQLEDDSTPFLLTLLSNRIERCQDTLKALKKRLEDYAKPILATHEKLVSILRQMAAINTKSKFKPEDIHKAQAHLKDIDERRVNGQFVDEDGNVLAGSDQVSSLLDRCQRYTHVVLERAGNIPEQWKPLYSVLVGIRNELDKLSLTQAWSLRETDLYDFQRQLDKIDESRVDGNWLDEHGRPAELYVQRTLLYLIRRSYGYIYHLMISSEPVSEALLPVYNQLQTLKRCLIELTSIDNLQKDGKFMVGDDIPEGQGAVLDLLNECFDRCYKLRLVATEAEEAAAEQA